VVSFILGAKRKELLLEGIIYSKSNESVCVCEWNLTTHI